MSVEVLELDHPVADAPAVGHEVLVDRLLEHVLARLDDEDLEVLAGELVRGLAAQAAGALHADEGRRDAVRGDDQVAVVLEVLEEARVVSFRQPCRN